MSLQHPKRHRIRNSSWGSVRFSPRTLQHSDSPKLIELGCRSTRWSVSLRPTLRCTWLHASPFRWISSRLRLLAFLTYSRLILWDVDLYWSWCNGICGMSFCEWKFSISSFRECPGREFCELHWISGIDYAFYGIWSLAIYVASSLCFLVE